MPSSSRGTSTASRASLREIEVPLGDLPEKEVAIRSDADGGVNVEVIETRRPVIDHVGERLFAGSTLLDGKATPLGRDL
jgi:hypothetical protein